MRGINFEGANDVIGRPPTTTSDQCDAAIVHRGIDTEYKWCVITMCWQMSTEELKEVIRNHNRIFLRIFSDSIPMLSVTAHNPVKQGWVRSDPTHAPRQPDYVPSLEALPSERVIFRDEVLDKKLWSIKEELQRFKIVVLAEHKDIAERLQKIIDLI